MKGWCKESGEGGGVTEIFQGGGEEGGRDGRAAGRDRQGEGKAG